MSCPYLEDNGNQTTVQLVHNHQAIATDRVGLQGPAALALRLALRVTMLAAQQNRETLGISSTEVDGSKPGSDGPSWEHPRRVANE